MNVTQPMKRSTGFSSEIISCSLALCLALATIIGILTIYVNEDLYLSFAAGRDIENGLLATPDHWSFTAPGKIWVNQAWLSHFILFKAFEKLGPLGPVLIKVILLTFCVGLTLHACLNVGASLNPALFSTCLGLLAADPFLGIRPENFGLFYLCVFLWLLSEDGSPGWIKAIGVPLTFLFWSNSHGSFMLGLTILLAYALLTILRWVAKARLGKGSETSGLEAGAVSLITLGCVLIVALVNPYGTSNLTMPFTQLGTEAVTAHSADWLGLFDSRALTEYLFGAASVYPYLVLLFLLLCSAAIRGFMILRGNGCRHGAPPDKNCDRLLQGAIAVLLVLMSIRFRRLVLFAALPLATFLSVMLSKRPGVIYPARSETRTAILTKLKIAACVAFVLGLAFITFRSALPYFPGNPFRTQRPVVRELMSFDTFSPPLITFLKTNRVWERVFPGWEISPFLMSNIPEIKVFMDCRDQSFYPASVIEDYFTVLGLLNRPGTDAGSILDRYAVSAIVFTSDEIEFDAAVRLMNGKKWVCLYSDLSSFVLVRVDGPYGERIAKGFEGLVFPDESSAILTRAVYSYFFHGRVEAGLEEGLRKVARANPRPNLYVYIVSAMENGPGRLKAATERYLLDEAGRLSAIRIDAPGYAAVLESLENIYGMLATNAHICGNGAAETAFSVERIKYRRIYSKLRERYYAHLLSLP